jgi:hypothetical protein
MTSTVYNRTSCEVSQTMRRDLAVEKYAQAHNMIKYEKSEHRKAVVGYEPV